MPSTDPASSTDGAIDGVEEEALWPPGTKSRRRGASVIATTEMREAEHEQRVALLDELAVGPGGSMTIDQHQRLPPVAR